VAGKLRDENFGNLTALHDSTINGTRNKRKWRLLLLLIPLGLAGLVYTSKFTSQHKTDSSSIHHDPAGTGLDTKGKSADSNPVASGLSNPAAGEKRLNKNAPDASRKTAQIQSAGGNNHFNNNNLSKNNYPPDTGDLFAATTPLAGDFYPESFHEPVVKPISLSVYGPNEIVSVYGMPISLLSSRVSTPDNQLKKTTSPAAKDSKGIYVGFRIGPDLSMVKFQSVEQPGFSLGVLVGYRFNKRLAIETGLMWDKKYYYSKGEYFNTDKIHVPQYATIMNVNGNCTMWEIPLALRYDFATTKNHGYFAKAGFSSYIMTKQNYTFSLDSASHQWNTPYIPYNNTLKYFLATIQLSGGYERAISEKTKIRIEPYVNIPLQGVGTGSLPISSAGFYLGISHSFR
jgi:hypothetical protein